MSYQEKHALRKKIIKIGKEICPKVKVDLSGVQLYIPVRKKSWMARDTIDVARQVIEQVGQLGTKGVRTIDGEEQENQFLFVGSGVDVYVEPSREGVNLFTHETGGEI